MDLGATIKNLRTGVGIRQNVLADKCDISQAYLSQIENNQKDPNLSTIKVISEKLGVPLPVLFFMSLDEKDVKEDKKAAFQIISPLVNKMLYEVFATKNKDN